MFVCCYRSVAHEPDERVRGGRHARKARGAAPPRLPAALPARAAPQPPRLPARRRAPRPKSHPQAPTSPRRRELQPHHAVATATPHAPGAPGAPCAPSAPSVLQTVATGVTSFIRTLSLPPGSRGDVTSPGSASGTTHTAKSRGTPSERSVHLLVLRESIPPKCKPY